MSASMENTLLAYVAQEKLHPALLLVGPDAQSKMRTARRMAKAMLCPKRSQLPPFCGVCSTCRRIEAGLHPDVVHIGSDPEDSLKVEAIRELCHQMELPPLEGHAKIAIVEGAERMQAGSSNAFLKTLEEPVPGHHFWLLAPQPASLLPTVLSRCLVFAFAPAGEAPSSDDAEMEKFLSELLQTGDWQRLVTEYKDREKCLELVHYLQMQWRLTALHPYLGEHPASVFQSASLWDALLLFDEAVQLEGRLRSNANPGLLLENHLRSTVAQKTHP